jgi:hypothetical protein
MRTSLQLFKTVEPPCDMFEYLGSVVRNTTVAAVGGILQMGVRNDFTKSGKARGRTGIMANAFGPEDDCANRHRRRDAGDVHVGIDPNVWWTNHACFVKDTIGVQAFVAGAGAIVFSNVNWRIASHQHIVFLQGNDAVQCRC